MSGFHLFLLGGLAFVAFGAFFVGQGVTIGRRGRAFTARSVITQGQVIDLRRTYIDTGRDSSRPVFMPVVRFTLPDGRGVDAATMTGSNPAPARVGQVVDVRYDPDDPTRVNLVHGPTHRSVSVVSVVIGIGLALFGLVFVAGAVVAHHVLP